MQNRVQLSDQEERLKQLRERDLEIASIAQGLQMRTRIIELENENKLLRTALATSNERLSATIKTFSWKITKPLRFVRRISIRRPTIKQDPPRAASN